MSILQRWFGRKQSSPKKPVWTPIDPEISCHMPFSALEHVFIFTEGDGKAVLESRVLLGVLQDAVEAPLELFFSSQHVRKDIIGHAKSLVDSVVQKRQIPDELWSQIAVLNPQLAAQAKKGLYRTCIRNFTDPEGFVALFYSLHR